MQQVRPRPNVPRIPTGVLAGLLGLALLIVVGCTQVGDNLTGVQLNRGRPTTCIKQCNDLYKMLYDDEQKAHAEAKEQCDAVNCAALPKADQQACIDARQACQQAEAARHEAEMDRLSQAKKDCQDNCHRQGTGSAG